MFTRRNGNIKLCFFIFIIVIFSIVFSACSTFNFGSNDWKYDKLPNNYQVWQINSNDIVIGKYMGVSLDIIIETYVIEFCFNDMYIGVKQIQGKAEQTYKDIEDETNSLTPNYYIIDTKNDIVFGPYDIAEYQQKCENLNIDDFSQWIKTVPIPEGAKALGID